jgi:hypothetical protein
MNHALLIGVSHYENFPESSLIGPANDVSLMQQVLVKKGFAENNIQIIADNVTTALPTRHNILTALEALAKIVTKEDFVYLHFAGHGSQQPATKSSSKHDGIEEIFLPRDVGYWQENGSVKNAIVDKDINEYLKKLLKKCGFVWIVFDCCHSGSMTRAALPIVENVRNRQLDPETLGIPSSKLKVTQTHAVTDRAAKWNFDSNFASNFVGYYAAQASETTLEMPLPLHNPEKTYGLFTYTLAEMLTNYDDISYRQAAQLILNLYAAHNTSKETTPLFEGSLDKSVLGNIPAEVAQQWLIEEKDNKFKIEAGQLHQLAEESILAIIPNPASNQVLGYVKITRADLFESEIKSVEYDNKPALKDIPQAAYARLVAPKIDFTLLVALPPEPSGEINDKEERARQVLKDFVDGKHDTCVKTEDGKQACVNIKWVKADNIAADLRLLLQSNKLWLLPTDAELIETNDNNRTSSINLDKTEDALRDTLIDSFLRIARVRNLLRLSTHLSANDTRLKVGIRIDQGEGYKELDISKTLTLYDGTKIELPVNNSGNTPIDVTILYIDSQYGIHTKYPEGLEFNRIEAQRGIEDGTEMLLSVNEQTGIGMEYLMVISVQAKSKRMVSNFDFLSQPSIPAERNRQGTDEQESLYDLFSEAVFGGDWIRDLTRVISLKQTAMLVFSWKTSHGS